MDWIMPLLAGLGIGSILKSLVDSYVSRKNFTKDRYYNEKKDAYLKLIESIYLIAVEPSLSNKKKFGLYSIHCKLFCSKKVFDLTEKLMNIPPESDEQKQLMDQMIEEMRRDLKK